MRHAVSAATTKRCHASEEARRVCIRQSFFWLAGFVRSQNEMSLRVRREAQAVVDIYVYNINSLPTSGVECFVRIYMLACVCFGADGFIAFGPDE